MVAMAYLAAAVLLILALKGLSSPESARRGNLYGMIGMFIAVVVTLQLEQVHHYGWIFAAMAAGGAFGMVVAKKVPMTAMPQVVAAMHSLIGLAAVLIAVSAFYNPEGYGIAAIGGGLRVASRIELFLGTFIGAITFTASIIAFSKLQGILSGMAKRGVTEIVSQGNGFDQILIQGQLAGDGAAHLSYFQAVGEAGAVEIALVIYKDLGLVFQPAEGGGMDYAVAVALNHRPRRAFRLRMEPAAALLGAAGIGGKRRIRHMPQPNPGAERVQRRFGAVATHRRVLDDLAARKAGGKAGWLTPLATTTSSSAPARQDAGPPIALPRIRACGAWRWKPGGGTAIRCSLFPWAGARSSRNGSTTGCILPSRSPASAVAASNARAAR